MGTRAAFWIGDPRQLDSREWLGCKAWGGFPDNKTFKSMLAAKTADEFRAAVEPLTDAKPDKGWPYPWADHVFLTDFTYAFIDGGVMVSCFSHGLITAEKALGEDPWPDSDDPSLQNIPAPKAYDPTQPDSIMFISIPG